MAPALLKVPAMFVNGLCLGMIWGLVFSYMEGRRTSEILGAVLCASFIVSSGAVKSVGILLMQLAACSGVLDARGDRPRVRAAVLLSVWGLSSLPPPSAEDEAARVRRAPMTGQEVRAFLRDYGLGVTLLVITYVFATALRDFRDNFAAELWTALGYSNPAGVFTSTELAGRRRGAGRDGHHRQGAEQCTRAGRHSRRDPGRPAAARRLDLGLRCRLARSASLDDPQAAPGSMWSTHRSTPCYSIGWSPSAAGSRTRDF